MIETITESASIHLKKFQNQIDKIYSQQKGQKLGGDSIEWIGLRHVHQTTTYRSVRDGKPQMNSTEFSEGVMAEVLVCGQFGYAATSHANQDSLEEIVLRAKQQALAAAPWALHRFTTEQRPPVTTHYQTPVHSSQMWDAARVNETLLKISEKLRVSPKIVRTVAYLQTIESEVFFVSSNGSAGHQKFSAVHPGFEATSQDGMLIQKRTATDQSFQGGLELWLNDVLWEKVQRVGEQALELLDAEECPSEVLPLILMPDQMLLQIHESIGHPLEMDRILGDERNYAGWSFVEPEDFGRLEYGSPLMNVTFDPTLDREFASYAFDDTGAPSTKEYLIRNGKLVRGLGGLESQIRSGIPGVANARASSWNRPPIDRMANINLEPGDSSLEEMVGSVERGIQMETNRSWSIDDFRNKFQFGCEYARLIENGKLTRVVRNPNYRGVTVPFWKNLNKVGNLSTYAVHGTPSCGKGEPNQLVRVGHASPVCLFSDVEVFGGAS